MGIHDGHRDRMRDKIASDGIKSLKDHEILEYILFHFVPRRNTNEIAHALIDKFGSFSDVLNADVEQLSSVPGMTRNAALFLNGLPDIFRRYASDVEKKRIKLGGRGTAQAYMRKMMFGCPVEQLCIVALDAQDRLVRFECLFTGDGESVPVSMRKIVEFVMRTKAVSVLIAHNHPSGNCEPSQRDFELTREIYRTLGSINVRLQDHIIFSEDDAFSFEDNGLMDALAPRE